MALTLSSCGEQISVEDLKAQLRDELRAELKQEKNSAAEDSVSPEAKSSSEPTPEPTPKPTPEPTPEPTPTPKPTPESVVPSNYPEVKAPYVCSAVLKRGDESNATYETMQALKPWAYSAESKNYGLALIEMGAATQHGIVIGLPSLELRTYHADFLSGSQPPATYFAYIWNSNLVETSFSDLKSNMDIELVGEESGWFWGDFGGWVGRVDDATVVVGKFTCSPDAR